MNRFERVREICGGWGLYEEGNSTEQMQILKAISEAGELADSIAKNDREQAKDDIGDILVCLINAFQLSDIYKGEFIEESIRFEAKGHSVLRAFSHLLSELSTGVCYHFIYYRGICSLTDIANGLGLTLNECLDQAISEIEKRKGKIINGVFVKDSVASISETVRGAGGFGSTDAT